MCSFVHLVLFCFVSDSSIIRSGKYGLEETRKLGGAKSAVLNPCLVKIRSLDNSSQVSFRFNINIHTYLPTLHLEVIKTR